MKENKFLNNTLMKLKEKLIAINKNKKNKFVKEPIPNNKEIDLMINNEKNILKEIKYKIDYRYIL